MPNRFWVGGNATWDNSTVANWSTTTGGGGGASVPGASDVAIFDGSSPAGATVTTNYAPSLSGLTLNTGFTGTLTLGAALTTSGNLTVTQGSLDSASQTLTLGGFASNNSNTRSITLGTSTITLNTANWSFGTSTNLTFSGASSDITLNGSNRTFAGGGLTYGNLTMPGGGTTMNIQQANTFTNLTVTGTAAVCGLTLSSNQTVTGVLDIDGNSSTNVLKLTSNTVGTQRTITCNGTTTGSNLWVREIKIVGLGAPLTVTNSWNDLGNNIGVIFGKAKSYLETVLGDSPASLYILNEISGTAAKDLISVQNGVYAGGYTQAQSGVVLNENVYSTLFDGSSGQVTVANNANQQPGTGDWTVECWCYPTTLGGSRGVVTKDTSAGYSNPPWCISFGSSTPAFQVTTTVPGGGTVNYTSTVATNTPCHIVGWFDSSNTTIYVAVNGVVGSNSTSIGSTIGTPTGTVRIGQQKNTFNRWFEGKIQYCAFYNKLLTPTQILNHYNAGIQEDFLTSYLKA